MIFIRAVLAVTLLQICVVGSAQPLKVVGYALYSELDESLFIASLKATDDKQIGNGRSPVQIEKQLEFKFLKARFAAGRFTRLLLHNAAINNPDEAIQNNKEFFDQFVELMNHSFYRGDHIVFSTQGNEAFAITLDGVEIGRVKSRELFDILLNGWIGDVPPTRIFKESLLGGGESASLAEYYPGISYSKNRRIAVEDYVNAKKSLENDPPVRLVDPDEFEEPPVVASPAPKLPAGAAVTKPASKALNKVVGAVSELEVKKAQLERHRRVFHMRRSFATELVYHAQQNIIYPRRSQIQKQMGNVLAVVTIDRSGMVRGYEITKRAEHESLNRAVEKGLRKSQPFPQVPHAIDGDTFTFQVPIAFALKS